MANETVGLFRLVKVEGKGWVYRRVDEEGTRRGRGWTTDWNAPVTYQKEGEVCLEVGPFQLKWYVSGGKAKYQSVGLDLRQAAIAQDQKISELKDDAASDKAGRPRYEVPVGEKTLLEWRADFLAEKTALGLDPETVTAYQNVIDRFLSITRANYKGQITKMDLLEFRTSLAKKGFSKRSAKTGVSARTIHNLYGLLCGFFLYCKFDHKEKFKAPKFKDKPPTSYSEDEIKKFFAGLPEERHKLFFRTLLLCGLREREGTHLTWADVNFNTGSITIPEERVTPVDGGKPIVFKCKTKQARTISVSTRLMASLKEWKAKNPGRRFVFGTRTWRNSPGDRPDGHMLELVKQVAYRQGLNCGDCDQCRKSKGKNCSRWKLHKFRSSCATWLLQGGVDLRSVSAQLGHQRVEVTNRYLAEGELSLRRVAQDKIDARLS
jgi:integrase